MDRKAKAYFECGVALGIAAAAVAIFTLIAVMN